MIANVATSKNWKKKKEKKHCSRPMKGIYKIKKNNLKDFSCTVEYMFS